MTKKKSDTSGPKPDAEVINLETQRNERKNQSEEADRRRRERMDEVLAEMNRDNAVVLDGGKVFVLRFERDTRFIDGAPIVYDLPVFLRRNDFNMLYCNRYVETGVDKNDQPIFKELGQWWLKHPRRQQYRGITFVPAGPEIIDGRKNLWRGWGIVPKQGDWSLMRRHIKEVLAAGDEDVEAYIIKWIAWLFQYPDRQAEAAIVFLSSDRGTGKGTLARGLCRIFGQHGLHISTSEDLTGKFNAHLRQCCFLFCDEAYGPKDKSAEGQLKRFVTEGTIPIEPKQREKIFVPNLLHIMIASNEDWAVPAGSFERRWVVQNVSQKYRQDPKWFIPLNAEIEADGLAAMLFDLLQMPLGEFHPRQIVRTAALARQQEESLSPLDAWWLEVLHVGEIPGSLKGLADCAVTLSYEEDMEVISTNSRGGTTNSTRPVERVGLLEGARTSSPKLRAVTEKALGHYLSNEDGVVRAERWRTTKATGQKRGWKFPELATCRDRWCERFPDTDWSRDGVDEWTERAEWQRGARTSATSAREPEIEREAEPEIDF